jgi:hypothetical protein
MTSRISSRRLLAVVLTVFASFSLVRAQDVPMGALIGESLAKLRQDSSPEAYLNCVAELKRIDAMAPGSAAPKYYIALQSLNFAVSNPHAEQAESLIAEAGQAISQLEDIKDADQSDLCTLKGFLYMVRIVQDPARNGQRYYLDVMDYYEKALKFNPDNALARQLQEKFYEGMRQQ